MSECPICGEEEEYDGLKESCENCGHYNESKAHGYLARRQKQWDRRIEERRHKKY